MNNFPDTLDFQSLYDELLMIPRSITGEGFSRSIEILSRYIPFELEYYPSGSQVLDWTVPPEWHLERAVLKDSRGRIILDSDTNPLYVLNYSTGFQGTVTREELEEHLYTDDRNPEQIPYVTSYYRDRWGFCLSENMKAKLTDTHYEVDIRASKNPQGNVVIAICDLPGMSDRIVQISSYLCHPNMLNNELSGPLSLLWIYLLLAALPKEARRYTYRFIINPETIGSICYLSRHADELRERLEYGMTVTCTGSFYSNEYAGGKYQRIRPIDLSALKAHLQHGDSSDHSHCAAGATSERVDPLSSAATVITGSSRQAHTAADTPAPVPVKAAAPGAGATAVAAADCSAHGGGSSNCAAAVRPVTYKITSDPEAMECYHSLLDQIEASIDENFLQVPVTFKMTRQSLIDEISHMLAGDIRADHCVNASGQGCKVHEQGSCGNSGDNQLCTRGTADPELTRALSLLSERECHEGYLLNGALHEGLSNEDRVRLFNWAVTSTLKDFAALKPGATRDPSLRASVPMTAPVDRTIALLEQTCGDDVRSFVFLPYSGADERQYNSPLFNLPVISTFRATYRCYAEYHSSHDSQNLFSLDSVIDSAVRLVNFTRFYERREEKVMAVIAGEPQLGSRGLYPTINCCGQNGNRKSSSVYSVPNIVHLLNLADGNFTVEQLARVLKIHAFDLLDLIDHLCSKKVLAWAPEHY